MKTVIYNVESGLVDSIIYDIKIKLTDEMRNEGLALIYTDLDVDTKEKLAVERGQVVEYRNRKQNLKTVIADYKIPEDAEHIVFYRHELGLGDIVTTLATVQDIAIQNPYIYISYYTDYPLSTLLENHPDIDEIKGIDDEIPIGSYLVKFGNPCPASRYESRTVPNVAKNRIELFKMSVNLSGSDTLPKLYLSSDEVIWGNQFVGANMIGLVARSSANWRNYPYNSLLCEKLEKYGIVMIDDTPSDVRKNTSGLSIRETMSVVNAVKLVITPDTGWMHVAGALGINFISLFGSIDPIFRAAPYPTGTWLTGNCPYNRQPCWYDICVPNNEIPPCMSIEVDDIVKEVKKQLRRKFN